jgi:DNA-binding CsgD family transcriptional regulator
MGNRAFTYNGFFRDMIGNFIFRVVLNSVPDGVSLLDTELRIIDLNFTMQQWYKHKMPARGKKCFWVFHGRKTPCPNCPSIRAVEEKRVVTEVASYDGLEFRKEKAQKIYAFPLFDENREVVGVLEYVKNLIPVRELEEEVQFLREKVAYLERQNAMLRALLEERQEEERRRKAFFEKQLRDYILPTLKELEALARDTLEARYFSFLSFWLTNLYSDSRSDSRQKLSLLTPRELEIALLIKEGKSSKEISEILSISKKAVQFHRQNLRKKLGIARSRVNLVTYLRDVI